MKITDTMKKLIHSLCVGNDDGSLRLRNYPGYWMMHVLTYKAENEQGELCACCMAVRCLCLMAASFVFGSLF